MSVVVESPKVVLFSTVKVAAIVVERVVPPTTVTALAKTSPSASTKNLAEPLTESDNKLESEAAEEGLMAKLAPKGLAPDAPTLQEPKLCAQVGANPATNCPLKVEVAVVEVAWKYSAATGPTTESLA